MLSTKLTRFYLNLQPPPLGGGFEWLFPQQEAAVKKITRQFYKKFYSDNAPRRMMIGINPGRLGAGITGINFTAPKQLKEDCGIGHLLGTSSELSAAFIYEVINKMGGVQSFYHNWLITSMCPLGFIKNGKNVNYYDDKKLLETVTPFMADNINQLLSFGLLTDYCICIGEGKNLDFLNKLNMRYDWFKKIISLPHPRYIMQYRLKEKNSFLQQYQQALQHQPV